MQLLTQSALLKALGWSLFNSLWQMALLWLLYRIVLAVFPKASAHARHGLACLVLGTGVVWAALSGSSPWPDGILWTGEHWETSFRQAGRELIREALPYCSFLYLLVLAFLFIRYANQVLQARQLKRSGLSKIEPGLRVFVAKTGRLMGIRQEVRVWLSSRITVPVTLGFLKPVILIPLATVGDLSLQQLEAILLHELAHIKRNDYLLHLGVTILEVLFFFNPMSRLLIRDIKREREHRCDDVVMQFRYDPHAYVSALLSLAKVAAGGPGRRQLALAVTGGSDQLLLQRVRRILQLGETRNRPGARTLIFLLLILAGTFLLLSRSTYPGSQGGTWSGVYLSVPGLQADKSHAQAGVIPGSTIPVSTIAGSTIPGMSGNFWEVHSGKPPVTKGGSVTNTAPSQDATPSVGAGSSEKATSPEIEKSTVTKVNFVSYTMMVTKAPVSATHTRDRPAATAADPDDDPAENGIMAAADEDNGPDDAPRNEAFAGIIQPDDREYSMGPNVGINGKKVQAQKALSGGQPFVPHSSFSFQLARDTLKLKEQYAYLQSLASHEVEEAVKRMQKELQAQLRLLQTTQSKELQASLKAQRQILEEQLRLQESFLRKQKALERKLERAGKVRRIVVI
ncbi:MAG TPA: M56 family metallopeptidase [Puia sp.]|nr:M56 family metallopeptidase [Puia sp.]